MARKKPVREGLYLSFTNEDNEVLKDTVKKTGYNATALLRRLMLLYAAGNAIGGMVQLPVNKTAASVLTRGKH